jgi:NAD(P)-dependent dehydrogenase (short-subunit alcohol dehydrogenase family)
LLAARGARVVVNDLGGSMEGHGADAAPATEVAHGIVVDGGDAIADTNNVAAAAGAQALVERCVDAFGGVDIVVNNAGIIRWAALTDADADHLERHLAVHVGASYETSRAAWPHLIARGYGRIVMTTSSGVFGHPANFAYAAAKGAVLGLARALATAGTAHGIAVNLIAPAAATRMGGEGTPAATLMTPEMVAPMAAFLAHESCPVTGEIYQAGGGRFARMFLASTPGYVHRGEAPTIEDVAEHWAAINADAGYTTPADLAEWSTAFSAHLAPPERQR